MDLEDKVDLERGPLARCDFRRRCRSLPDEKGTLVLFWGQNSMHRVTPATDKRMRMRAGLVDDTEPDVSISGSARMSIYGRLGESDSHPAAWPGRDRTNSHIPVASGPKQA